MDNGKKFSRKREAIYRCVCSTKSHPTAEWVYQQLKPDYPDLSLGTVYRNLSAFKQSGVIQSVGVFDGQEHFDGNVAPHLHFFCLRCGAVQDIPFNDPLEDLERRVSETAQCTVNGHRLTFWGICRDCKKNENQEN